MNTTQAVEHKFSAYLITGTHVASRLPLNIGHVDCTCGWSHESLDVTDGGQAIDKHWRRRNWACRSCADAA